MGLGMTGVRDIACIALASDALRSACAPAALITLLLLAAVALRSKTRYPLGQLGVLSLGLIVAWEALLLNILSLARAVTLPGVLAGNLLAAAWLVVWLRTPKASFARLFQRLGRSVRGWRAEWLVAPLALLLLLLAWSYPPTTYDALSYHLARVAHWIQNQSVAYYPTPIDRQNWMAPGAEYLILLLQLGAGSDRWANSVQWLAWLLALAALPSLARTAGIPRRLAIWVLIFAAGLPMGVLQACSTQTDMVATAMTLALIAASLPLLHDASRWTRTALSLMALMLAAALLVKPTAVLAASPFLLYIGAGLLRRPAQLPAHAGRLLRFGLPAIVLFACVAGPHLVQSRAYLNRSDARTSSAHPHHWSYSGWRDIGERAINPLLATFAHHDIGRTSVAAWLRRLPYPWAGPAADLTTTRTTVSTHEDQIANPVHVFASVALGLWWMAWCRTLRPRTFWFALAPFLAWLIFHAFIRNQTWISRLQTPLFFMLPLAWAAVTAQDQPCADARRSLLVLVGVLALAAGYAVALDNHSKPWIARVPDAAGREVRYYMFCPNGQALKAEHDRVLERMVTSGQTRLGLTLGSDDCEYPLTWRAMQRGIEVRHCAATSTWPEATFPAR